MGTRERRAIQTLARQKPTGQTPLAHPSAVTRRLINALRLLPIGFLAVLSGCNCEDVGAINRVEQGTLTGIACTEEYGFPARESLIQLDIEGESHDTVSDERGAFRFDDVKAGQWPLSVTARGSDKRTFDVEVIADEVTHVIDSACRDAYVGLGVGDLEGIICDRHVGDLIADAAVTLTLADGTVVTGQTDDEGAFLLTDVPEGEHVLQVTADGFQRTWLVLIDGGETNVLDVGGDCTAPDATNALVSGTLCDPSEGGGLAGAEVRAEDSRGEIFTDITDAEGSFTLGPMTPGNVSIVVTRGDLRLTLGAIAVAGDEVFVTNGGDCVQETCVEQSLEPAEQQEGAILFVVDRSGSMSESAPTYGTTRWAAVADAIGAITIELEDAIEFGLVLFPDRNDDSCGAGGVDVEPAYGRSDAIIAELDEFQSQPLGATPTAGSLQAARTYLNGFATSGKNIAVVLATDGGPNCNTNLDQFTCECSNPDVYCGDYVDGSLCLDAANAVSQVSALALDGIDTYVIGIPGSEDFGWVLDDMAVAGNTAQDGATQYIAANDLQALENAFQLIGRQVSACSLSVDENLALSARVSVVIDGTEVSQDGEHQDGFDVEDENTLALYGDACEQWQSGAATLTINLCTLEQ